MKPVLEYKVKSGLFQVYDQRPNFSFHEVIQVHGRTILKNQSGAQADGIIFNKVASLNLGIKTADCLPIYIHGPERVAMIHAGWRGLRDDILRDRDLAALKPNYAFIGPCISWKNYPVGDEFKYYFPPKSLKLIEGQLYLDLRKTAENQLKVEYPNIEIEISSECTLENSSLHSFRLNKSEQRNYNIFKLLK